MYLCKKSKKAINSLKNWKASETDGIPAKLVKYGGKTLHQVIYELCQKIQKDGEFPEEWNKAIVLPLHKRGDKLNCYNYRDISQLNTTYKLFSDDYSHLQMNMQENTNVDSKKTTETSSQ